MKNYHLYAFTENDAQESIRVRSYVSTLPEDAQLEVDFVPLKTVLGNQTQLASEFSVTKAPTLVFVHEDLDCSVDVDGDEDCTNSESVVEIFFGSTEIIEHLPATLDAYTYAAA